MPFSYSTSLTEQRYAAGAKQPAFQLEASCLKKLECRGIEQGYSLSFPPGGAELVNKGPLKILRVKEDGAGRVALLLKAWRFREVKGHTPRIWNESFSACEGGLLLVCDPGFQFEAANYRRQFRRFEVGADGSIMEVEQSVEAL